MKRAFKANPAKYTEKDLRNAYEQGYSDCNCGLKCEPLNFKNPYFLSIPKIPIGFEPNIQTDWKKETKLCMEANGDNPKDFPYDPQIEKIRNVWQGKHVYKTE